MLKRRKSEKSGPPGLTWKCGECGHEGEATGAVPERATCARCGATVVELEAVVQPKRQPEAAPETVPVDESEGGPS